MTVVNEIISGFKWTVGVRLAGQVFNWMVTIVVIRLLEPEDYGIFAVAVAITTFLTLLSEFGIGDGLIWKKEFGERLLKRAFGYILIINAFLFGLLYSGAPYVAEFYESERLTDIMRVQAFEFLILSFGVISSAKIRHKLRFKRLSLITLLTTMTGGGVTLFLALNGFGIWSLVWGSICRNLALAILVQIAEPALMLPNFDIRDLDGVGNYGFVVLLTRLVFFVYSKADILIMSKALNIDLVGFYTVAKDLATLPMARIAASINIVGLSAFSKFEGKTGELTGHYLKAITSIAFVSFPVFIGISSVSPEIVPLALGEKWMESIPVLQVIAFSVPFRLFNIVHGALLQGTGNASVNLRNTTVAVVLFVPLFAFALRWGGLGVAFVWAVVTPMYFAFVVCSLKPYVDITLGKVSRQLIGSLFVSVIMYLAVRAVSDVLGEYHLNTFFVLTTEIIIGVLVYSGASFLFNKRQFKDFISLVRRNRE